MFSKVKDLLLADVFIVASMLLPFLNLDNTAVRVLFAAPLVFIIPGYVFTEAFFDKNRLEAVERWALTLGMSLGLTVLVGFILNQTNGGLQYISWTLLLGSLSFVCAQIALGRRLLSQPAAGDQVVLKSRLRVEPLTVLFVITTAFIVFWTVSFAQLGVASSSSPFTQFWMLPASSSTVPAPNTTPPATGAPGQVAPSDAIVVGLKSWEKEPAQFSVIVKLGNQVLQQWQGISLQPGESWQEQLTVSIPAGQTGPVQAFLYKLDTPDQVYRTVTWWPPVSK